MVILLKYSIFNKIKFFTTLVLLLTSYALFASLPTPKPHPIDVKENVCRKAAVDTMSIINCIDTATKEWDHELNVIYQKNMTKLDKDLKNDLKASQLKWLQHRDAEFRFYNHIHSKAEGTISGITHSGLVRDFIKHRVQMLYQIYESDDYSGDSMSGYVFWGHEK